MIRAARWRRLCTRLATLADDSHDALERDGGLTHAMARWALATTLARYDALAPRPALVPEDLEGRDVALLLARSVPTAPLRAIALPLLRGARRLRVHAPATQRAFAQRVCAALDVELAPESLRGADFARAALGDGADTLIAFGADATLARVRASLPEGVRFEGRGHGVGVALVLREAVGHDAAAAAVAHDVAAYDQHGCLSPQCILVEGDARAARAFAGRLADALEHAPWPRGALDAGLAVALHQWQGATAARASWFHRGTDFAVASLEHTALVGSPGARHVAVVPCGSIERAATLLAPIARALTTVGVAGTLARLDAASLPPGASPRVVSAGTMQDPPLDGYEDPRAPRN